ncbi:MAG: PH domain-containing protein [Streptococcus salivarius]
MGLFSGLLGNASKKDNDKVERQLEGILIPGEQVELAYVLVRDLIVFTEKRLILVDKQGVTGKKTSYKSIPYHSISRFTVESSGHFDLDAELKIWISSALEPAALEPAEVLQFKSDNNVFEIQQALAAAVLK